MIDMGMGEDDPVDRRWAEGEGLPVEMFEAARSLEEAAINEEALTPDGQFHAGTGDSLGGAVEAKFDHDTCIKRIDAVEHGR